jgi:hypothetical protein
MSKIPDSEPRETVGIYQVWHKEVTGFRHVANVEGGNLLAALVLPHLNKDESEYKSVTPLVDDARASTFGDVIVNPEQVAFEIYKEADFGMMAWRQIDFAKVQFKQILEEHRTDYEAARLRDTEQNYEKFLAEATAKALLRMDGKDDGHERQTHSR